jgi:hypothetical protein
MRVCSMVAGTDRARDRLVQVKPAAPRLHLRRERWPARSHKNTHIATPSLVHRHAARSSLSIGVHSVTVSQRHSDTSSQHLRATRCPIVHQCERCETPQTEQEVVTIVLRKAITAMGQTTLQTAIATIGKPDCKTAITAMGQTTLQTAITTIGRGDAASRARRTRGRAPRQTRLQKDITCP